MNRLEKLEEKCEEFLQEVGFGTSRTTSGDFEEYVSIGRKFFSEDGFRNLIEDIYHLVNDTDMNEIPDVITFEEDLYIRIPDSWQLQEGDIYFTGDEKGETLRTGGTGEQGKIASDAIAFYRSAEEFRSHLSSNRKLLMDASDGDEFSNYYIHIFGNNHFISHKNSTNRYYELSSHEGNEFSLVDHVSAPDKDYIKLLVGEKVSSPEEKHRQDVKKNEGDLEVVAKNLIDTASEYAGHGDVKSVSIGEREIEIVSVTENDQEITVTVPFQNN